jgi:sulfonate transport system substrate-binding protein
VQNRYGARVLTNAQGILTGDYLFAVRKDLINDVNVHHQIENYLFANQKAFAWRASNPQVFSDLYSKVIGVPAEIILQSIKQESQPYQFARLNQKVINDTAEVIKTFADAGLLTPVSDISSAFDFSFQNILSA